MATKKQVTRISMQQMINYNHVHGMIMDRCHEVLTKLGVSFDSVSDCIEIEMDGDRGTGDMFIFYYLDRESGLSSTKLPISAFLDDKFLEEHIKAEKQRKLDEHKKRAEDRKQYDEEQEALIHRANMVGELYSHFTEAEIKALIEKKMADEEEKETQKLVRKMEQRSANINRCLKRDGGKK